MKMSKSPYHEPLTKCSCKKCLQDLDDKFWKIVYPFLDEFIEIEQNVLSHQQ